MKNHLRDMWEDKGQICIERMTYITEYLIKEDSNIGSANLKRAKAIAYYLSHKLPIIYEKEKLIGTMTSKKQGMHLYAELNDLVIWRDLSMEKDLGKLTEEESILLNKTIFPYWMDKDVVAKFEEKCQDTKLLKFLKQQGFCKISVQSGLVLDFSIILKRGLSNILEEVQQRKEEIINKAILNSEKAAQIDFYESVQAIGRGLIDYVKQLENKAIGLSEKATSKKLQDYYLDMAKICKQVPLNPAKSFLEAVQSIWFYLIAMGAEYSLEGMSLGRLDQVLYPYYEQDIASGQLSEEEAAEILKDLWCKLGSWRTIKEEKHGQNANGALSITIGGIDEEGRNAVNELTYLFLKIKESAKIERPILVVRIYEGINPEFYIRLARQKQDEQGILIAEDPKNIQCLIDRGVHLKTSFNYVMMANRVLGIPSLSYEGSAKLSINLVAIIELILHNGKRHKNSRKQWGPLTGEVENYEDFDDFLSAYQKQGSWLINQSIKSFQIVEAIGQESLPVFFGSIFFKSALEEGRDLTKGSSVYIDEAIRFVGFKQTIEYLLQISNRQGQNELFLGFEKWVNEFLNFTLKSYVTVRNGSYYVSYDMDKEAIKREEQLQLCTMDIDKIL